MRSRGMTYVLLAVVLGIWGVVAWKLFFARPDSPAVPETVAVPKTKALQTEADTLRLDYCDPFLRATAVRPATDRSVTVAPIQGNAAAPAVEPPAFTYTGMIRKGRTPYFLFLVNGIQEMIRPGGSLGEYRLASGCADSVVMTRDNRDFCLKPQS
ncbi:MAG: hypothetical protein IJC16_07735 [Rikenellaceae bacterium]|nr:hypothetical protein [Rikenellaceae bacterium]